MLLLLNKMRRYAISFMRSAASFCPATLWTILILTIILPPLQPLNGKEPSSEGEGVISSLYGLDLQKVHLFVDTDYPHHDTIRDRTLGALSRRGLKLNAAPAYWPYKQGQTVLHLTVRSEPLHGEKSEKVLYYQKLEIFEYVVSERTPHIRTWAVTWSHGLPEPIVSDKITIEHLKKTADEMLEHFILDYSFVNGKRE